MHPTKKAAHIAGAVYLSMVVTGPLSLIYVPNKLIVSGNATATAANVIAHDALFCLGIVAGLFGQVIFICLGVALYRLLGDVNKTWARLMFGFVLVSAAVGFVNELKSAPAFFSAAASFLPYSTKRNWMLWACSLFACMAKETR